MVLSKLPPNTFYLLSPLSVNFIWYSYFFAILLTVAGIQYLTFDCYYNSAISSKFFKTIAFIVDICLISSDLSIVMVQVPHHNKYISTCKTATIISCGGRDCVLC